MKKIFVLPFCFLLPISASFAADAPMMPDFSQLRDDRKVAVQNQILAKLNGRTISVLDVKKRMDVFFYQNFPQFAESPLARQQFYEASWRNVLNELINSELLLAEAEEKELKLTDGEVREEMEKRFGPNVMSTLDKLELSYDEAWKMIRNEMIVQRMSWWFIHMKAEASISPQDIRQAYRLYLEKNPSYSEWRYRVVTLKMDQSDDTLSEKVYQWLKGQTRPLSELEKELKTFEKPGVAALSISNEFKAKTQELSDTHKVALEMLFPGEYSKPAYQVNRIDKKGVYRIFYLIDKQDHPAPSFETMAAQLKAELNQKAVAELSHDYLSKLRKRYGYEAENHVADDLHPFSLQ